jgi:hypothetical protein
MADNTPPPKSDDGPAWVNATARLVRDLMPAIIGLVILSLSTWMLCDIYGATRFPPGQTAEQARAELDAYNRRKDVLVMVLAVFGTVTGYYLGRVPAEWAADKAQKQADKAQDQANKAQDKASDAAQKAADAGAAAAETSRRADELRSADAQNKRRVEAALALLAPPAPGDKAAAVEVEPAAHVESVRRALADVLRDWR